jgi:hypothetical protein
MTAFLGQRGGKLALAIPFSIVSLSVPSKIRQMIDASSPSTLRLPSPAMRSPSNCGPDLIHLLGHLLPAVVKVCRRSGDRFKDATGHTTAHGTPFGDSAPPSDDMVGAGRPGSRGPESRPMRRKFRADGFAAHAPNHPRKPWSRTSCSSVGWKAAAPN